MQFTWLEQAQKGLLSKGNFYTQKHMKNQITQITFWGSANYQFEHFFSFFFKRKDQKCYLYWPYEFTFRNGTAHLFITTKEWEFFCFIFAFVWENCPRLHSINQHLNSHKFHKCYGWEISGQTNLLNICVCKEYSQWQGSDLAIFWIS